MKTPSTMLLTAGLLAFATSAATYADSFLYENSLRYENGITLTTTPSAASDYFKTTRSGWGSYPGWYANPTGDVRQLTARWDSALGLPDNSAFILKDLHDGNLLASNTVLATATISIDSTWVFGDGVASMGVYLGLLNDTGKGYAAYVDRTGVATLYSIDNPATATDSSTWTVLAGSVKIGRNTSPRTITFSLTDSSLSVSVSNTHPDYSPVLTYSFGETGIVYTGLDTLVVGAKQAGAEAARFSDLKIEGTTSVIPEPKTTAFLLGGVLLLAIVSCRTFSFGGRTKHE